MERPSLSRSRGQMPGGGTPYAAGGTPRCDDPLASPGLNAAARPATVRLCPAASPPPRSFRPCVFPLRPFPLQSGGGVGGLAAACLIGPAVAFSQRAARRPGRNDQTPDSAEPDAGPDESLLRANHRDRPRQRRRGDRRQVGIVALAVGGRRPGRRADGPRGRRHRDAAGTAQSPERRKLIGELARSVEGVAVVINAMEVPPPEPPHPFDLSRITATLRTWLTDAIAAVPYLIFAVVVLALTVLAAGLARRLARIVLGAADREPPAGNRRGAGGGVSGGVDRR